MRSLHITAGYSIYHIIFADQLINRQTLEELLERFEAAGGGSDADHRDQSVPDLLTFGALRLRIRLGAGLLGNFLLHRLCAFNGPVYRRVSFHLWRASRVWRVLFSAHFCSLVRS